MLIALGRNLEDADALGLVPHEFIQEDAEDGGVAVVVWLAHPNVAHKLDILAGSDLVDGGRKRGAHDATSDMDVGTAAIFGHNAEQADGDRADLPLALADMPWPLLA